MAWVAGVGLAHEREELDGLLEVALHAVALDHRAVGDQVRRHAEGAPRKARRAGTKH